VNVQFPATIQQDYGPFKKGISMSKARAYSWKTVGRGPRWLALLGIFLTSCGCGAFFPPLDVVENVDVQRYTGKWFEIARYPNNFEQGCVGSTAEYTLQDDGSIRVVNTCRQGSLDGPIERIEGTAVIDDPTTNAKLLVSFFPPFQSPYWIIELDEDYEYAVVGEPSRSFLWILSRSPSLDDETYQGILDRLPAKGYDPVRLERTLQPVDGMSGSEL
jgi:apolipoprotein D and lipocalin family protein